METVIDRPPPTGEGLTFEKVWAMFQETDRKFEETKQLMQKNAEETDRQFKETKRLMEKSAEKTDKIVGKLGNRFGELVEHLVAPNIMQKFNELGFAFTESSMDVMIKEPGNPDASTDIDILLENGDTVIAIEVKAKPNDDDVKDHIKRMEILRRRADRRSDTRKYQGAIAGAIINQSVHQLIVKNGFYPIEQSGDTVKISIPEKFSVREW